MFKKTRIRLVLWNTIVFFFILLSLGALLYIFMDHQLLRGTDDKLNGIADHIQSEGFKEIRGEHERETERKVAYLFWNKNNRFIGMLPKDALFSTDVDDFKPNGNSIETRLVGEKSWRVLTVDAPPNVPGDRDRDTDDKADKVMLVLNIDPEMMTLKQLLKMIIAGSIAGLAISLIAGSFLASLSLKPIQKSWVKQTQFAADASHELRTPLTVIQTHLELLFRHPSHTIEQESEGVYKSLNEVKRMNKLVSDLLTLSRADSNEKQIEKNQFEIGKLVSFVAEQFQPVAELKGIELTCEAEDVSVNGDKDRLHQLLMILLDNAIKYTGENGTVHLTCRKEAHSVLITAEDNGIGIPPKDLPYIFDRFYRSDKSRTRSEGGTGLGLSIAEWIVKAHKGEIKAVSSPGEGTKMIVKIPI